jgi:hypothetical protein
MDALVAAQFDDERDGAELLFESRWGKVACCCGSSACPAAAEENGLKGCRRNLEKLDRRILEEVDESAGSPRPMRNKFRCPPRWRERTRNVWWSAPVPECEGGTGHVSAVVTRDEGRGWKDARAESDKRSGIHKMK